MSSWLCLIWSCFCYQFKFVVYDSCVCVFILSSFNIHTCLGIPFIFSNILEYKTVTSPKDHLDCSSVSYNIEFSIM